VSRHGYWLQWQTDLRIFLSRCQICLERHVGPLPRHARLQPFIGRIARPGTQASCDLFGPLPACNGYKYCLSYQDRCSRYLSLAPLKNKEAGTVARALLKIMLQQGFPAILYSDQGSEFVAAVTQELLALMGVQHHRSFSYRPQSNGGIERVHRFLGHMFSTVLPRHTDWVQYLDFVAFCYNSMPNRSTSFSPHFIHWGREAASPIQALLCNPQEEGVWSTNGDLAQDTLKRLHLVYDEARKCSLLAAENARKMYDPTVKEQKFSVGDAVLLFSPRVTTRQYPKWKRSFSVAGTVVERINDICYVVKLSPSGKLKCVHPDKLKLVQAAVVAPAVSSD
jgi:hypothetical protein